MLFLTTYFKRSHIFFFIVYEIIYTRIFYYNSNNFHEKIFVSVIKNEKLFSFYTNKNLIKVQKTGKTCGKNSLHYKLSNKKSLININCYSFSAILEN